MLVSAFTASHLTFPLPKGKIEKGLRQFPRPKRLTLKNGIVSLDLFARFCYAFVAETTRHRSPALPVAGG
jgi:hypothetical protein